MKIVLANGCFELHPGHVRHLREAKSMGDILVVSLTIDECVNKGPNRPIHAWADRKLMLEELRCVDCVIPSRTSMEAIRSIKPHIFVKGCDYFLWTLPDENVKACAEVGAEIRFTTSAKMSSTEIIRRMAS